MNEPTPTSDLVSVHRERYEMKRGEKDFIILCDRQLFFLLTLMYLTLQYIYEIIIKWWKKPKLLTTYYFLQKPLLSTKIQLISILASLYDHLEGGSHVWSCLGSHRDSDRISDGDSDRSSDCGSHRGSVCGSDRGSRGG